MRKLSASYLHVTNNNEWQMAAGDGEGKNEQCKRKKNIFGAE